MEYLKRYYRLNHPINILESCIIIIPPSPILDSTYLKVIPENLWLFLVLDISIKILYVNNLLAE
jgi:hypothetical protein